MKLINNSKASTEIYNISSIATQCPREGGATVYRARTLMYFIDNTIKYSDDINCNSIAVRRGRKITNIESNYSMFPDKQNSLLNFSSNSSPKGPLIVNVFDAQGKLVQSSIIETPNSFFNLNFIHSSNQFYLISIIDNTNFHHQNFKLVW